MSHYLNASLLTMASQGLLHFYTSKDESLAGFGRWQNVDWNTSWANGTEYVSIPTAGLK
jgi:hypothetical protein